MQFLELFLVQLGGRVAHQARAASGLWEGDNVAIVYMSDDEPAPERWAFNAAGYDVKGRVKGLERNPANLLPVVMEVGVDPVHFGIIMMLNLGIGLVTPPVGSVLFVGSAVGGLPVEKAVKTIWPFYMALVVSLLLITYVPALSLTLPGLFK